MLNIGFEDFEAVAAIKYHKLDDGAFHRAMIICTKNHKRLNCTSDVMSTNALTRVKIMHKIANDVVDNFLWRHK